MHTHEKLLISEMFSRCMNQHASAYQIKGTLLGVSGWLTHASQGVSVTPLGSNATPARALWDIMTPCVHFCRKHF